ncbi:unnamed protein product [Amoebophrya sp. A120]|nr:unnamed protein product [Amoebophrya sp. A120]|eukprot:GSA120T00010607001.1
MSSASDELHEEEMGDEGSRGFTSTSVGVMDEKWKKKGYKDWSDYTKKDWDQYYNYGVYALSQTTSAAAGAKNAGSTGSGTTSSKKKGMKKAAAATKAMKAGGKKKKMKMAPMKKMSAAKKKMVQMKMKTTKKKMAMKMKTMKKKSAKEKPTKSKTLVYKGKRPKTTGGLTKADLKVNKRGKVVSKKASAAAMKKPQAKIIVKWSSCVKQARASLGFQGVFVPVGGKTERGQRLYRETRMLYDAARGSGSATPNANNSPQASKAKAQQVPSTMRSGSTFQLRADVLQEQNFSRGYVGPFQ